MGRRTVDGVRIRHTPRQLAVDVVTHPCNTRWRCQQLSSKLDDLRTKYISPCNRMSANIYNFTHMLQNSEPDKINNLAKFLCGLKLYGQ